MKYNYTFLYRFYTFTLSGEPDMKEDDVKVRLRRPGTSRLEANRDGLSP